MITHDTGYSVMLNAMYPVLVISVLTPVALKTFGQLALHTVVCVLISFPFESLHVSHFFFFLFFSYLAPIIIPALRWGQSHHLFLLVRVFSLWVSAGCSSSARPLVGAVHRSMWTLRGLVQRARQQDLRWDKVRWIFNDPTAEAGQLLHMPFK